MHAMRRLMYHQEKNTESGYLPRWLLGGIYSGDSLCADAMIFFAFFQNLFQISSASFLHPKQEIVAALVALA